MKEELVIRLVSVSDRASAGVYRDEGIPALKAWLASAIAAPAWRDETRLIADEQPLIEATLKELVDSVGCQLVLTTGGTGPAPRGPAHARLTPDEQPLIEATLKELVDSIGCHLVLTTGGTGPAPRDVTPEATLAIAHKVLPGFGEQMRQVSLKYVPTAILSRQLGVVRGRALILNLPGQPKAIKETLDGVFPAVPYCIDLIGGPYIETNDDVCKAFRPKSAVRPKT